jgi:hypothetical protein
VSGDLLKYMADKVNEEISIIQADLAKGGAKDFGDYKFHCGRVQAHRTVVGIIMEIADRMNEDMDD